MYNSCFGVWKIENTKKSQSHKSQSHIFTLKELNDFLAKLTRKMGFKKVGLLAFHLQVF